MRLLFLTLIGVLAALVLVFTFQNLESVTVAFLSTQLKLPVSALVILIYIAGMFRRGAPGGAGDTGKEPGGCGVVSARGDCTQAADTPPANHTNHPEVLMRTLIILLIFIGLPLGRPLWSQVRTVETRTSVDSVRGDTTVSKSVIISDSEDITPRTSMIVINPLKFFLFYNLSYYHRLSAATAVGVGFQAPTVSGIDGFGVNAEVRIYPSRKALRGFYLAPNFSANSLKSGSVKTSPTSAGVLIGWQWFPGDEFAMGLGIGVDYYFGSVSDDDDDFGRYDGTAPALRFDIGYAW